MLSLKSRVLAVAATGALAALLALPAFAQAFWWDDKGVAASTGGVVPIEVYADTQSTDQTVNISYNSDGPAYSGPSSLVVPAGQNLASFDVEVGPGNVGESVFVGINGPTTRGSVFIWLE